MKKKKKKCMSVCVCEIPLPSGFSRSGVTVAVMSGQTAYAEITRAPEAAGKPSLTKKHTQAGRRVTHKDTKRERVPGALTVSCPTLAAILRESLPPSIATPS